MGGCDQDITPVIWTLRVYLGRVG